MHRYAASLPCVQRSRQLEDHCSIHDQVSCWLLKWQLRTGVRRAAQQSAPSDPNVLISLRASQDRDYAIKSISVNPVRFPGRAWCTAPSACSSNAACTAGREIAGSTLGAACVRRTRRASLCTHDMDSATGCAQCVATVCLQASPHQMAIAAGDASVRVFDRRKMGPGAHLRWPSRDGAVCGACNHAQPCLQSQGIARPAAVLQPQPWPCCQDRQGMLVCFVLRQCST